MSVLPGIRFPEIIDWSPELMGSAYVLPDEAVVNTITPSKEWEFAEKKRGDRSLRAGADDSPRVYKSPS